MNDKIFLDSNILVYSYSNSESEKQFIARKIIAENNSFISTQVLQELTNTLTRKFNFSFSDAQKTIEECCNNNNVCINNEDTIRQACRIAQQYNFSFYVSAAIESGSSILYTEDLKHQQKIDSFLVIINPFI